VRLRHWNSWRKTYPKRTCGSCLGDFLFFFFLGFSPQCPRDVFLLFSPRLEGRVETPPFLHEVRIIDGAFFQAFEVLPLQMRNFVHCLPARLGLFFFFLITFLDERRVSTALPDRPLPLVFSGRSECYRPGFFSSKTQKRVLRSYPFFFSKRCATEFPPPSNHRVPVCADHRKSPFLVFFFLSVSGAAGSSPFFFQFDGERRPPFARVSIFPFPFFSLTLKERASPSPLPQKPSVAAPFSPGPTLPRVSPALCFRVGSFSLSLGIFCG